MNKTKKAGFCSRLFSLNSFAKYRVLKRMVNSYYWVYMFCFCDYFGYKSQITIFENQKSQQYGGKHTYI